MQENEFFEFLLNDLDETKYEIQYDDVIIEGDLFNLKNIARFASQQKLDCRINLTLRNVPKEVIYEFMLERFRQYGGNWQEEAIAPSAYEKIYDKFSLSYQNYEQKHQIHITIYRTGTITAVIRGINFIEEFYLNKEFETLLSKLTLTIYYPDVKRVLKAYMTDDELKWRSLYKEEVEFDYDDFSEF